MECPSDKPEECIYRAMLGCQYCLTGKTDIDREVAWKKEEIEGKYKLMEKIIPKAEHHARIDVKLLKTY